MLSTPETSEKELPTNLQTVDEFEVWERQHPHEGSYEFVRGHIIPKPAMKQDEFDIADFFVRLFMETPQFKEKHILMPELDPYVDGRRKRVPDLAYFTADQRAAIRQGERARTRFAIEILSDSESYEDVIEKITERGPQDYFDGGAELVWYVVPNKEKIYVYTSPDESKAYKGSDTLSAAPVLPDFRFVVSELFAK